MRCLIYRSRATHPMMNDQLRALLDTARAHNARDGITGCLVYVAGNFMQLLEGPAAAVQSTFDRISTDQRHQNVTVVLDTERSHATFNNWWMACANVDGDAEPPRELVRCLEDVLSDADMKPLAIHQAFEQFRRTLG